MKLAERTPFCVNVLTVRSVRSAVSTFYAPMGERGLEPMTSRM